MQPIVSKRRFPKPTKELKPSKIEEGIKYFMETGNQMVPVRLLVYPEKRYTQSLSYSCLEETIENILEEGDAIPLDIYYLTHALQDGRLYLDSRILNKLKDKSPVKEETDIYKELEKEYCKSPKSVYFRYLDILKRLDIKANGKHLDWICDRAGYSPGWKFYKSKELGLTI